MKPIAVFQHTTVGAPGAIVPILQHLGHEVELIRIVDGAPVPPDASSYSGLVLLGGYMSAHDPLPWIAEELALVRDADARGIPVAGHCLGSQLLALALGGAVQRHTRPEIGWGELCTENHPEAHEWWGALAGQVLETFQWHSDTFMPPQGACRLAVSQFCENQVYVYRNRHLLIQSHLEMTPELIATSLQANGHQLVRELEGGNPAARSVHQSAEEISARAQRMNQALGQLYTRWCAGLLQ